METKDKINRALYRYLKWPPHVCVDATYLGTICVLDGLFPHMEAEITYLLTSKGYLVQHLRVLAFSRGQAFISSSHYDC